MTNICFTVYKISYGKKVDVGDVFGASAEDAFLSFIRTVYGVPTVAEFICDRIEKAETANYVVCDKSGTRRFRTMKGA